MAEITCRHEELAFSPHGVDMLLVECLFCRRSVYMEVTPTHPRINTIEARERIDTQWHTSEMLQELR